MLGHSFRFVKELAVDARFNLYLLQGSRVPLVLLAVVLLADNRIVDTSVLAEESEPQALAPFSEFEAIVRGTLEVAKTYEKNDIITRDQIAPVLKRFKARGWELKDSRKLSDRLLSPVDYMVRQLRSKQGLRFMRRIKRYKGGYDRVDRLRKMPYGNRRIRELITTPDGYKLIQYMTTTKYGLNLGKQLSKGVNGANFNKPTGRIYTVDVLVEELQKHYKDEVARRKREQKVRSSVTVQTRKAA